MAGVCGKPIKADLVPHTGAPLLRDVAAIAIERTDIQKEVADQIGIHRSRLTHKIKDGTLTIKQLEELGPRFFVNFGRELIEAYAPMETPRARLRAISTQRRRLDDEEEQIIDGLAS